MNLIFFIKRVKIMIDLNLQKNRLIWIQKIMLFVENSIKMLGYDSESKKLKNYLTFIIKNSRIL